MSETVWRGKPWRMAAPAGATALRLGGEGARIEASVGDGVAAFGAEATAALPLGVYAAQWEFAESYGPPARVVVADPVGQQREPSYAEQVVAKMEATLDTASGSADIGFSVAGTSYTFVGRDDLRLELAKWRRVVAAERGAALPVVAG